MIVGVARLEIDFQPLVDGCAFATITSGHAAQDLFISYLENLTRTLGLACLADFGISEQDFDLILSQTGNKNNPVQLSRQELADLIAYVFESQQ